MKQAQNKDYLPLIKEKILQLREIDCLPNRKEFPNVCINTVKEFISSGMSIAEVVRDERYVNRDYTCVLKNALKSIGMFPEIWVCKRKDKVYIINGSKSGILRSLKITTKLRQTGRFQKGSKEGVGDKIATNSCGYVGDKK